jgi:hypothetical protein
MLVESHRRDAVFSWNLRSPALAPGASVVCAPHFIRPSAHYSPDAFREREYII